MWARCHGERDGVRWPRPAFHGAKDTTRNSDRRRRRHHRNVVYPSLGIAATRGTGYPRAWRIPIARISPATPSTPSSTPSSANIWSPSCGKSVTAATATACPLRRARVSRVPYVWSAGPRLHPASVRRLHLRAPRALLVQATRLPSELRGTADGRARRLSGRRGAATGTGAPVNPDAAVSPALPTGVGSRPVPRRAARVCPRAARLLRAHRAVARHPGGPDRHGDGDPTVRERSPTQRPPAHPRARRCLQRDSTRAPHLSPCTPTERRGRKEESLTCFCGGKERTFYVLTFESKNIGQVKERVRKMPESIL